MLENSSPANRYLEVAVKTANPLQLVLILYDAAICSLQEAREHINRRDIAGRSRSLNKCIAIISELHSCLNIKEGGEIANSLDRLYDYMKRMIFRANVEQSAQPLAEIESLLENLRSAWSELIIQMGGNGIQTHSPEPHNLRAPLTEALAAAPQESLNISA